MKHLDTYLKNTLPPVDKTIEIWSKKQKVQAIDRYPKTRHWGYRTWKRGVDISVSLIVIVFLLSWLLPILALLIWLDIGFPILFVQKRVGQFNQPFCCIKLRTMRKFANRNRISRLGRFLRNNKLDELPQFINVLKGEMSLVGPRPHMIRDHLVFSEYIGEKYHHRHVCLPGITGLAQISGYEGRIKSMQMLKGRIRLDLFYLHHWSFKLELLILWKTISFIARGLLKSMTTIRFKRL